MKGLSTTTTLQNPGPWYQDMERNGLVDKEDPQLYCLKWMMRSEEPEMNRTSIETDMRLDESMADWMCRLNEIREREERLQAAAELEEERLQAANELEDLEELPVVNKMQDLHLKSFERGRERKKNMERRITRDGVIFEKSLRDTSFDRGVSIDADYRGDEDLSYDYDEDVCGNNVPVNLKAKPQRAAINLDILPGPSSQIATPAKEEPNSDSQKVMNVVYSALNLNKFQCLTRHPVSYLNELTNFLKLSPPKYSNVEGGTLPVGNINKAWFLCTVRINSVNSVGVGRGWNKRDSKSRAAAVMISKIGRGRSDVNINQFSDHLEPAWELNLRDIPEEYILGFHCGPSSASSEYETTSGMLSSTESVRGKKISAVSAVAEGRKMGINSGDKLRNNAVDSSVQSEVGNITNVSSTGSEMALDTANISKHRESRSSGRKRIQPTEKVENSRTTLTTCRRAADFSCEPKESSSSKPPVINPAHVIVTAKRPDSTGWYVTVTVAADATGSSQQEACKNSWVLIKEMAEEVLKEMAGPLPSPSSNRVSAVE